MEQYLEMFLKIKYPQALQSTKNSNLFGSINNNLYENIDLSYDFSIDNNLKTFESHSINSEISINNFVTSFNYLEQRGDIGKNHIYSYKTSYNIR